MKILLQNMSENKVLKHSKFFAGRVKMLQDTQILLMKFDFLVKKFDIFGMGGKKLSRKGHFLPAGRLNHSKGLEIFGSVTDILGVEVNFHQMI